MIEGALMLCATSRQSSWNDFAALSNKISKCSGILVIYFDTRIGTEPAHFSAMIYSFFPFGGNAASSRV
jgi:hypothetical protein